MKITEKLNAQYIKISDQVMQYLDRLSARERVLVIFTSVFVIVAGIGASLWYMHLAANNQQKRLNELKDTVVWMQSKVVTLKSASEMQLSTSDKLQRISQQLGLSVASQQNGDKTQLVVSHANYSVLANFLTQMAQMGISIEKIDMNYEVGQIKLTATVL